MICPHCGQEKVIVFLDSYCGCVPDKTIVCKKNLAFFPQEQIKQAIEGKVHLSIFVNDTQFLYDKTYVNKCTGLPTTLPCQYKDKTTMGQEPQGRDRCVLSNCWMKAFVAFFENSDNCYEDPCGYVDLVTLKKRRSYSFDYIDKNKGFTFKEMQYIANFWKMFL